MLSNLVYSYRRKQHPWETRGTRRWPWGKRPFDVGVPLNACSTERSRKSVPSRRPEAERCHDDGLTLNPIAHSLLFLSQFDTITLSVLTGYEQNKTLSLSYLIFRKKKKEKTNIFPYDNFTQNFSTMLNNLLSVPFFFNIPLRKGLQLSRQNETARRTVHRYRRFVGPFPPQSRNLKFKDPRG